ncbi:sensor of ECF-type sigma factor [Ichthyenterobacterium sp. W332]|uniref:Sensor of ECF-type sigma factor n=1 Tax=Microcosmobacter mediterraneus TaxID=3075607 RepID=A0ABU2YHY6_9FLAO|nr:sensor of ECF-type sigma factor [Ichthyenterobacterium sp. W332]MDT0557309.1 sensor of ECF-type sigma factor [Ichthyenterobacterium sp. W332]
MKTLIIPAIVMLLSFTAFAQPGGEKMRERIKAQKATFITNQLNLTSDEAQQFWPVYNAFEDKVEGLRKSDFKSIRQSLKNGSLSDADAQKALDNYLITEAQLLDAKKQLVSDLKNILSPQKIIKLKMAEDAFNRQLLDKLKKFREKRGARGN